jgi:Family of unknown function (DUF5906)
MCRLIQSVRAFLGRLNVTSSTLQRLETDRFATARLVGKLANICADLPTSHLQTVSVFKQLTGVDTIPCERKFKEPFDADLYARQIFSANEPPKSSESDDAFFSRWLVILMDHIYRGTDEDRPRKEIDAELRQSEELSGVPSPCARPMRNAGRPPRQSHSGCASTLTNYQAPASHVPVCATRITARPPPNSAHNWTKPRSGMPSEPLIRASLSSNKPCSASARGSISALDFVPKIALKKIK